MDKFDSNWNTQIKIDSLLRTKIKKRVFAAWTFIKTSVCEFFCLIFCKELWEFIFLLMLLVMVFGMLAGMVIFPIMSIRRANEVERAREVEETRLKDTGWICIECSDKVSAELLARKRSDAEFGTDNYSFQATNTINYKFWYLARPKANQVEKATTK